MLRIPSLRLSPDTLPEPNPAFEEEGLMRVSASTCELPPSKSEPSQDIFVLRGSDKDALLAKLSKTEQEPVPTGAGGSTSEGAGGSYSEEQTPLGDDEMTSPKTESAHLQKQGCSHHPGRGGQPKFLLLLSAFCLLLLRRIRSSAERRRSA